MKPESAVFMGMARTFLAKAPEMMRIGPPDEAARAAMAALNATRGLIFERTDTVSKTHGGTHSRFAELTRHDLLDEDVRRFPGAAFNLKTSCDYGIGPIAVITPSQGQDAISTADKLVSANGTLLAATDQKETP